MSIATQISRITGLRNRIRAKLYAMDAVSATADLEDCADALDTLQYNVLQGHITGAPDTYGDLAFSGLPVHISRLKVIYIESELQSPGHSYHIRAIYPIEQFQMNSDTRLYEAMCKVVYGYGSVGTTTLQVSFLGDGDSIPYTMAIEPPMPAANNFTGTYYIYYTYTQS